MLLYSQLDTILRFEINTFKRIQWRLIFANVKRCSRPQLWVTCFIYLIWVLLFNVFNGCSLVQLKKQIEEESQIKESQTFT